MPPSTWSITALAAEFGVTLRTLRHYEDNGLLTPERRGTTRVYHLRDRTRLQLILRGRRLGFSLPEIRTIVDMYDEQPGERGQLEFLLTRIEDRRADLAQRRRDIEDTLHELDVVEARCREDLSALAGPGGPDGPGSPRVSGAATPPGPAGPDAPPAAGSRPARRG